MDDKFASLDLPLRPEAWAYRMPQSLLGLVPTFWALPTLPAPSSGLWNHPSLTATLGPAQPCETRRRFGLHSCSRSRQQAEN